MIDNNTSMIQIMKCHNNCCYDSSVLQQLRCIGINGLQWSFFVILEIEAKPMSKRFQDSIELFGQGFGSSTQGKIQCDICDTVYNEGLTGVFEDDEEEGAEVPNTDFAGLTVCYCCYDKIETAVVERLDTLLPWLARLLASQQVALTADADRLRRVIAQIPAAES
ncbi:MAG: hypothetical protein Q7S64_02520 [bacterium]|nr:hypothetical protein [bacterium]